MRSFVLSMFVAAQLLLGAQPALAAPRAPGEQTEVGIFGGVQLRLRLGGSRAEAPEASLGIAPVARSQGLDGASRTRIGEGLQFSLRPNGPAEITLAGARLDRIGQAPGGQRAGVSTLGWIAIGVGATVVLVVGAAALCLSDSDCVPSE